MQLWGSLIILWHCLSLGLEWKLTFSSPVAAAEFSKFAGILSAALWQHHLLGYEITQPIKTNHATFCSTCSRPWPTLCLWSVFLSESQWIHLLLITLSLTVFSRLHQALRPGSVGSGRVQGPAHRFQSQPVTNSSRHTAHVGKMGAMNSYFANMRKCFYILQDFKNSMAQSKYLRTQLLKSHGGKKKANEYISFNIPKIKQISIQFSSVVQPCPTLCDPTDCSTPGLPFHHQLPEFTQTHVHQWCQPTIPSVIPLLLLPSIFASIRVFSNESALRIRWPKYWSFSFNISPSNEHPGLISFRRYWLNLLAGQGTLKSLLQKF